MRVLTFALACIMFLAVCIGMSVAIAAGIAYGYNYMLAEFLTLGRTDLAVYIRRGQFYDTPNFGSGFRRKGDVNDLFSSNVSDYQDTKLDTDSKPLSDTWRKALDTRKYAEKLTKYSRGQVEADDMFNNTKDQKVVALPEPTTQKEHSMNHRVYSITPIPGIPTTFHPARTNIVMRNYQPVDQVPVTHEANAFEADFYQDNERATPETQKKSKHKEKKPDIKISLKDLPKRTKYIPTRSTTPYKDYEVDEDNVVYKPV